MRFTTSPYGFVLAMGLVALSSSHQVAGGEQDQFEERTLMRCAERGAERAVRAGKSDRAQWLKVLEAAFPEKVTAKVTNATTEEDYGVWFDLLAGKNDEWRRDEAPNTQISELYDKTLQRLELGPVPSIKREEFIKFAKKSLVPNSPMNQMPLEFNDDADKVFRVLDKDSDGELTNEELTLSLKEEKARTDVDGNGRITKEEYRDYFKKKVAGKVDGFVTKLGGGDPLVRPGDKAAGKMGKTGLPDWFVTLDTDKDGQISLFEWREGGKPTEAYKQMDLDGDGLLTKDEYLRYAKMNEDALKQKKREEGK